MRACARAASICRSEVAGPDRPPVARYNPCMKAARLDRNELRARNAARRLLVQAFYQRELGGQDWQELYAQFRDNTEFARVDAEYFSAALEAVCTGAASLDEDLARHSELPPDRLDPVEHTILRLGLWELMYRPDIPYRVVINEGVELAKRFGATDGFRYVNAVLDRASRAHRPDERGEVA